MRESELHEFVILRNSDQNNHDECNFSSADTCHLAVYIYTILLWTTLCHDFCAFLTHTCVVTLLCI